MRLLVPAASAAVIASMALSVTAAVPGVGAQASSAGAAVRSTQVRSVQLSPASAGSAQLRTQGPAVLGAASATGTTKPTGADKAAANSAQAAPRGDFAWPLSPRPAVLRRFAQPLRQWSPGHRGVDLLAAVGQPVLSAGDGIVAFSGVIAGRGVITVRHPGGLRTTFEPVDERLAPGIAVHRGTRIGVISPTPGHCVPRHCLHWGAISVQTYRDPLSLLGFGRPILLPLG
jgi:murein DD-endopeptidase MepM/ murein hydrolase activator NlpD